MSLSLGIFYGIVAMVTFGLSNAFASGPSKEIGAERVTFFRGVFTTAILLFAVAFADLSTLSVKYILITFGIALVGYVPLVSFYKALSLGTVGVVTPVANSSVIFTLIFSVLLFGESLSLMKLFAILLILSGIVLMTINFSDFRNSRFFDMSSGIPYALLTCLLWGLLYTLFKIPVTVIGPIMTSFIVEMGILFYSGLYLRYTKKIFFVPGKKILKGIFMVALTSSVGLLAYNVGILYADVSIVSALSFANPLVSAVYARVFFKERMSMQQIIAALVIVLGIVFISYV